MIIRRKLWREPRGQDTSTTVSRNISASAAGGHTIGRTGREAGFGRAAERRSRSTWRHVVQAAPGAPLGLKPLGRRAGRRKARGAGGENLARSAPGKAKAAGHNAP